MPQPSSATRIRSSPPPSISTSIRRAPASQAFSTSSLTTEAGRSMTSPAAMRATTSAGRTAIGRVAASATAGSVQQHLQLPQLGVGLERVEAQQVERAQPLGQQQQAI